MPDFADIASVEADIIAVRRGKKDGDLQALIGQHAALLEQVIGLETLATWDSGAVECHIGGQTFHVYQWPKSYWAAREALLHRQCKLSDSAQAV